MKWYIIIILSITIILTGCSEEVIYLGGLCNCTLPNATDINVYNCTTRTDGQAGYDYSTNEYYYCNSTTWVKLSNQSGGTIINNYTMNMTQIQDLGFNNITQDALSDFNYWGCLRNGTYCDGLIGSTARTIATAYTASTLRCFPYITGKGYKIDWLGVRIGTANTTAGQYIQVALYSDNGLGYPGTLLANTSSNTIPTTGTGFVGQTISTYQLNNNTLYWLCSTANATTSTARVNVVPIADYPSILGLSGTTANNIGYTVAFTYGNPLPNPYTAGATYVTAIYPNAYARVRTDI